MRMSPLISLADRDRRVALRPGVTLMEMLVVLALFGLATAIIMPNTSRMLDQATAHAVFFEFQRDVSAMRREANRTGLPLELIDPAATLDPAAGQRVIALREPWRYTIAPALKIDEGGVCSPSSVNLLSGETVIMKLRTEDATCRFIRVQ